ncbi:MarR family winged helix-turn-helix transcriptional regulator [Microbacterium sp.]|uniref:MarR family winged helix-turn-helix transcriptional regulator n=1 Tax=Microbacterium sp. TaxID=51671 RepID=UPI0037C6EA76
MPTPDPADAIAAAIARLRGRRGPRGPWAAGAEGMPHWAGPHGDRGGHAGRGRHPGHGPHGMPFWGPHPRFAGPARLRLLEALSAASHPLSVSQIAEAIGVDQPRASRLVQQAVEMGLVRREADPDDARRTRVVLTDEGAKIVRGFRGDRREAVAEALAGFTDQERAELARLLTKLADAWPR